MQSAFVQSATWVRGAPQRNACPARRRELLRSCAQEERRLPEGVGPAEPPVPNFGFVGAEKLGVSFTCTAGDCGTRISKMIRRSSYEKGTVLIQCPTCRIKHIISDNLGWYSDTASNLNNIEKIAESKGERVIRVDSRVFGLESLMSKYAFFFMSRVTFCCGQGSLTLVLHEILFLVQVAQKMTALKLTVGRQDKKTRVK